MVVSGWQGGLLPWQMPRPRGQAVSRSDLPLSLPHSTGETPYAPRNVAGDVANNVFFPAETTGVFLRFSSLFAGAEGEEDGRGGEGGGKSAAGPATGGTMFNCVLPSHVATNGPFVLPLRRRSIGRGRGSLRRGDDRRTRPRPPRRASRRHLPALPGRNRCRRRRTCPAASPDPSASRHDVQKMWFVLICDFYPRTVTRATSFFFFQSDSPPLPPPLSSSLHPRRARSYSALLILPRRRRL